MLGNCFEIVSRLSRNKNEKVIKIDRNKLIQIIESKEWDRLIAVATYEKKQHQEKLEDWFK